MPIFDFICKGCQAEFELLVLGNSPVCPYCKCKELQKKMSTFSVGSRSSVAHQSVSSSSRCSGCSGGSCATCH